MSIGSQLDAALAAAGSARSPDDGRLVFGQEYLVAWYAAILAVSSIKFTTAGDSTTVQSGIIPTQTVTGYLAGKLVSSGLIPSANLVLASSATSGETAEHWRLIRVGPDAGAHPTLYKISIGGNDPGWLKSPFSAAPLDAGDAYPGRRTAQDTADSLDAGLTVFRASNPMATASVVLCSPYTMYDEPNGRYAPYFDALVPLLKALARKHQCCYVGTYEALRDSKGAAGVWMDDPMTPPGRGIHPKPVANLQIASLLYEALVPALLRGGGSAAPVSVAIPLAGGWVPWNAATHGVPMATKVGGIVTLSGLMKSGAVAPGSVIGTLPVGMRPAKNEFFSCCSASAYGSISINGAGQIMIDTCPSNSFFSIAGASFLAEN